MELPMLEIRIIIWKYNINKLKESMNNTHGIFHITEALMELLK